MADSSFLTIHITFFFGLAPIKRAPVHTVPIRCKPIHSEPIQTEAISDQNPDPFYNILEELPETDDYDDTTECRCKEVWRIYNNTTYLYTIITVDCKHDQTPSVQCLHIISKNAV